MTDQPIQISFALTPRMQSFIETRDALRTLSQAIEQDSPYAWLPAAKEIHDLLLGEGNKKPAIPNIMSLFGSMRKHYMELAKKYPEYQDKLQQAGTDIDSYADIIRKQVPDAMNFLESDAWLHSYLETIRTFDLLGYKLAMPQLIDNIWHSDAQHALKLQFLLSPILDGIEKVNDMLHAHAPWQNRTATAGHDQVALHAQDNIGLIIIGLSPDKIADGVIPSCSGFRSTIRIRFSQWKPGKEEQDYNHDFDYTLMMVPIL